jgi:hypothetical protein
MLKADTKPFASDGNSIGGDNSMACRCNKCTKLQMNQLHPWSGTHKCHAKENFHGDKQRSLQVGIMICERNHLLLELLIVLRHLSSEIHWGRWRWCSQILILAEFENRFTMEILADFNRF